MGLAFDVYAIGVFVFPFILSLSQVASIEWCTGTFCASQEVIEETSQLSPCISRVKVLHESIRKRFIRSPCLLRQPMPHGLPRPTSLGWRSWPPHVRKEQMPSCESALNLCWSGPESLKARWLGLAEKSAVDWWLVYDMQ